MTNYLKSFIIFFVILFTYNISYSSVISKEDDKFNSANSDSRYHDKEKSTEKVFSVYGKKVKSVISEYTNNHYLNATYVISENGKVIASGARGIFSINGDEKVQLKPSQQMAIASGTKPITAAGILRLQDKGMLDVNDTVAKLLPVESKMWPNDTLPEWAHKVTLHHLLTHSSGIAEYIPELKVDFSKGHANVNKQILNFAASKPLAFEPGSQYTYGNTGFIILGLVIEHVSKEPLYKFFAKEFFKPLGMKKTFLSSMSQGLKYQRGELSYKYPDRYFMVPNGSITPNLVLSQVPFLIAPFSDGGIVSTSKDMLKFHNALHNGAILSDKSYKQMMTEYGKSTKSSFGLESSYGYGIFISKLSDGSTLYHHAGSAIAIRSEFGYIPESKICYSIISNTMVQIPDDLKDKIDLTNSYNQIDIGFFKKSLLDGIVNSTKVAQSK